MTWARPHAVGWRHRCRAIWWDNAWPGPKFPKLCASRPDHQRSVLGRSGYSSVHRRPEGAYSIRTSPSRARATVRSMTTRPNPRRAGRSTGGGRTLPMRDGRLEYRPVPVRRARIWQLFQMAWTARHISRRRPPVHAPPCQCSGRHRAEFATVPRKAKSGNRRDQCNAPVVTARVRVTMLPASSPAPAGHAIRRAIAAAPRTVFENP